MIFIEYGSIEAQAPDEPDPLGESGLFEAVVAAARAVRIVQDAGLFSGRVEIQFSSDPQVRALNLQFRGNDAATDVLTFSAVNPEEVASIAIAIGILREQARRRGVSVAEEAALLALHAALHLAGYDDEEVTALAKMQMATKEFAARLGLPPCGDWHSIYDEVAA